MVNLARFLENLKKSANKDRLLYLLRAFSKPKRFFETCLKFNGRHEFISREQGEVNLLYILAGYEPYLWESVFPRIEDSVPSNFDVCIVSSGCYDSRLEERAEKNGWSYLHSTEGRIGQDQNLVIDYHPKAEKIFKLDEDIFIGEEYFDNILDTYYSVKQSKYNFSYIAPVINLNSFSFDYFLDYTGHKDEYEERFGEIKLEDFLEMEVFQSPEAAKFIWEITFPLEERFSQFNSNDEKFRPILTKYTIGGLMFEREFWEDMGYFEPGFQDDLGIDEDQIHRYSALNGYTPILSTQTFAGHFSFSSQKEEMKEFFKENHNRFLH